MDHRWIKTSIYLAMDSYIHSECKLSVLVILQKEVWVYIAWDTEASYYHDKGVTHASFLDFQAQTLKTDSANWNTQTRNISA